ncbi:hypothetical protein CCR95_09105 [Thiocystis minor]|nr:hypothetical protein [Thiocystis minor]
MVPMDAEVFSLATDLRVDDAIKTPDALHLAAALLGEATELWTNDKRLAAAARDRIHILTWGDFDGSRADTTTSRT